MSDDVKLLPCPFSDEQIKHMVDRFLGWKLPENFSPDAGISFKPTFNDHLPTPTRHEPIGTNLFSATQAEAMVSYMLEGLPGTPAPREDGWRPIESAPHGVEVILFSPGGDNNEAKIEVGYASAGWKRGGYSTIHRHAHATHWRPVPAPPSAREGDR